MDLSGRRALITGATGNLGSIFADTLAELGAEIILVDKPGSDFASLSKDLIKRWGAKSQSYSCDFEMESELNSLIEVLNHEGNDLNILINNAAFVGATDLEGWNVPFEEQSIKTWRRAIEVNLTAVFGICQGLMPLLKKSDGASIINIGSIYGLYGPDMNLYEDTSMNNPAAYGASKGGVLQLTRWLATNVAPEVRVNSISPGGVYRNQPSEFVRRYEQKTPLGRMASGDDLRGAITYLATDLSSYVTGQNLSVDGGWGIW
jgi:NAD(P)-dependent dehydrogenase (short-subunit alcohol dehydrogenase family)